MIFPVLSFGKAAKPGGCILEARPVTGDDQTALYPDEAVQLKILPSHRHARPTHTEHGASGILLQSNVTLEAIIKHQDPTCEPVLDRMSGPCQYRAGGLDWHDLHVAKQHVATRHARRHPLQSRAASRSRPEKSSTRMQMSCGDCLTPAAAATPIAADDADFDSPTHDFGCNDGDDSVFRKAHVCDVAGRSVEVKEEGQRDGREMWLEQPTTGPDQAGECQIRGE